jgi:hypothetical protein
MRSPPIPSSAKVEFLNVTPVWLLPFWRLVKGEARGSFCYAWNALPNHLPRGVKRPSIEALAETLYDHGLVR